MEQNLENNSETLFHFFCFDLDKEKLATILKQFILFATILIFSSWNSLIQAERLSNF